MAFPVNSTSVETTAIKRVCAVLARSQADRLISSGGVYICKKISGSNSYSQHSWGNAVDLFPQSRSTNVQRDLRQIADSTVYQATHRTVANRGRKLPVAEVIDHDARRIWTPDRGWHAYTGTTGPHIHVSGAPLRTGIPECA